jgi:hypothetical protein
VLSVVIGGLVASAAAGGSTRVSSNGPREAGTTNSTSTNWAGYAVTAPTPFTDVKGSWTQPAANCSSAAASTSNGKGGNGNGGGSGKAHSTYSSFWVGIDGYSSNTVEQTGTDADCTGTTPAYYGWYEFYPAVPVNFTNTVLPGDAMSGEVSVANGQVTITLTDATQHWVQTATQALKNYALSSAEWIAEAPSSGHVLPLADFGTATFTGASATGGGTTGSISAFTNDPITMATKTGQVKASTSALSPDGSSFTVTWQSN